MTSTPSSQTPIQQVVERILTSHQIARNDQELLLALLSSESLTESEKLLVSRVYELLSRGFIEVVD